MNRDDLWDITNYTHHAFGNHPKHKKKQWDCSDDPCPGASSEASCIWNTLQLCVAALSSSTNGDTSLAFQTCMDAPTDGVYAPYDWLNTRSTKGHPPYAPSDFTLGCLSSTTDVSVEDFQACLGLDGVTDEFIGSPGHTMLLSDFEYSEKTFKDAGVEEAGPTIFINGKLAYQGNCADSKGNLDESCKYQLLDLICDAHDGEKPVGCLHSATIV